MRRWLPFVAGFLTALALARASRAQAPEHYLHPFEPGPIYCEPNLLAPYALSGRFRLADLRLSLNRDDVFVWLSKSGRPYWVAYCADLPRGPDDDKRRLLVLARFVGGEPGLAVLASRRPVLVLTRGELHPCFDKRWRRRLQ